MHWISSRFVTFCYCESAVDFYHLQQIHFLFSTFVIVLLLFVIFYLSIELLFRINNPQHCFIHTFFHYFSSIIILCLSNAVLIVSIYFVISLAFLVVFLQKFYDHFPLFINSFYLVKVGNYNFHFLFLCSVNLTLICDSFFADDLEIMNQNVFSP